MNFSAKMIKVSALISGLALVFLLSCTTNETPESDQFDRGEMLENFAENLIKPGFATATQQAANLLEKTIALRATPSVENMAATQVAWQEAYRAYLSVSMYNFGPAGEQGLRKSLVEEVATFPVNINRIAVKTTTSTPNFADFERDSRGFLALDHLLYKVGALDAVVQNPNYGNYIVKVAEDISQRLAEINQAWEVYQTEFVANDGTDAGSSTSVLYNEFVKSYEGLKNFKVGLPLGLRPGQSQTEPEKVEALYSGLSLNFIQVQFAAITRVWYGGDGLGFDDYLEQVEGGSTLAVSTKQQISIIENQLRQFPTASVLSDLIRTNEGMVTSLHTELQKHTRFFKSELSSLLGIAITYTSGDGD